MYLGLLTWVTSSDSTPSRTAWWNSGAPALRCSTWSKVSWIIESIIVVLSGFGRVPGRGGRAAEGVDLGRRRWSAHQGTQSRQNRAQNVRSLSVAGYGTAPKAGPNAQVRGHLQPWPPRLGTHRADHHRPGS